MDVRYSVKESRVLESRARKRFRSGSASLSRSVRAAPTCAGRGVVSSICLYARKAVVWISAVQWIQSELSRQLSCDASLRKHGIRRLWSSNVSSPCYDSRAPRSGVGRFATIAAVRFGSTERPILANAAFRPLSGLTASERSSLSHHALRISTTML